MSEQAGVTLPRMRALDGLRGVAVIAVLLFHDQRLKGGYLGVDLFFVLSGFLITSLLLVDHDRNGRIGLRRFYERRARRLLPALGLALVMVAIYAAVWARPAELPRIRWDGFATLFYVQNWREIFTQTSYWDAFTSPSPLQHTWSLSIEEQFYALWPLLLIAVLAFRRSARTVLTVTLALAAAGATYTILAAPHGGGDTRFLYYSTFTRAPALLLGAALAALTAMRGPARSRAGRGALEVVALAGVAYLAYAWSHQAGQDPALYRGPLLLCGIATVAVIAAAAHPRRGIVSRALALPPLVGIGLISYGLYLFHWPVYLVLTPARTGISGWSLFAERVAVSVLLALASYWLLEQPIRHGALRPTRAFVALGTATAVVAVSLAVSTRVTPIPIPPPAAVAAAQRLPAVTNPKGNVDAAAARRQVRALSRPWPRPVAPLVPDPDVRGFLPPGDWSRLTNTCDVDHPAPAGVGPVRRAPGPKVLLLGDSVGCFVGASLDINQRQNGVVTLNRARLGCPLVTPRAARSIDGEAVTLYPPCIDGQQPAIAAFRPDVSVLMVGGPDISEVDLGDGHYVGACTPSFDSWYEAGARTTIEALASTGASVVVVSIVHPPKIVDVGPGITMPPVYSRDVECENAALRGAVHEEPRAHFLDLDAYVCPGRECRDEMDGVALRTDGRHFQGPAANIISTWILRGVLQQTGLQPYHSGVTPRGARPRGACAPRCVPAGTPSR